MVKIRLVNSLEMGMLCTLAGLIIGLFFSYISESILFDNFWIWAALSSCLSGTFIWYWSVIKKDNYSPDRGLWCGIIISIVSQYLLWYMRQIQQLLCFYRTGGCTNSFGEPPPDVFSSLIISAMLLLLSLFWFGWCTIPLGGLLGYFVAERQKRRVRRDRKKRGEGGRESAGKSRQ